MNLEKTFTAIIGNNISEKEIEKLGQKNNNTAYFSKSNTAESALAGAYISYLSEQGVKLTQEQMTYLSSKIEASLKRYKAKAKSINS